MTVFYLLSNINNFFIIVKVEHLRIIYIQKKKKHSRTWDADNNDWILYFHTNNEKNNH